MKDDIKTFEALAAMIQRTMAGKEDIQGVNVRLDGIDSRLDRIEHLLLAERKREIEDLKKRMKRLEDALTVQHAPPSPIQLPPSRGDFLLSSPLRHVHGSRDEGSPHFS